MPPITLPPIVIPPITLPPITTPPIAPPGGMAGMVAGTVAGAMVPGGGILYGFATSPRGTDYCIGLMPCAGEADPTRRAICESASQVLCALVGTLALLLVGAIGVAGLIL